MTREEAKQWIENLIKTMRIETSGSYPDSAYKDEVYIALDMAVKALEQQLSDDAISRQEAILQVQRYGVGCFDAEEFSPEQCERFVIQKLNELPSVTPKEKTGKYDKLKEAVGKIKAEIKAYDKKDRYPYGALGVSTALKIIDNHTEGLI